LSVSGVESESIERRLSTQDDIIEHACARAERDGPCGDRFV